MYEKILVPIDGSESSQIALDTAFKLAQTFNSQLYLLTVIPQVLMIETIPQAYNKTVKSEVIESSREILEKYLEEYQGQGVDLHCEYLIGNVSSEILKYTEDKNIDLVVMGNRGLGAFSRTILGSVSNKVVNGSKASVLVVKHK